LTWGGGKKIIKGKRGRQREQKGQIRDHCSGGMKTRERRHLENDIICSNAAGKKKTGRSRLQGGKREIMAQRKREGRGTRKEIAPRAGEP